MMPWEDVSVQLIDTPPITADYMDSHLQGLIRAADLALLLVDLGSDRRDRAMPGGARSAGADQDPPGGQVVVWTRTTWGCPTRRRSWCPTRSTLPEAADRLAVAARAAARWILPSTSSRPSTGRAWNRCATAIYRSLDVVRVYSKLPAAKEPDRDRPFTLRRGSLLLEMAGHGSQGLSRAA